MPRIPRKDLETNYYHVMTQGINKSFIFNNPEDIKYYIKIMYEVIMDYNIKIKAYCIMNNHAHILLYAELLDDLSKYMQRVNTRYGKYYNKKYNRVGYVFRDRFKSEGIYSKKQLLNCMYYIYNNPVKAGICLSPEEYPYSNFKKVSNIEENMNNYFFIDTEEDYEKNCDIIIKKYLEKNNINIDSLKKDKNKLRELILILNKDNIISYRRIGKKLKVSRETIRKLF